MHYSKTQAPSEEYTEKPNTERSEGNLHCRNWNLLTFTAPAHIKHNPVPSQIDIEPHTEGLFTSLRIIQHEIISFQQKKLQRMSKGKEKDTLKR